ncbi:MAG: relaxase/mobilization nuclease domain-containing protein [Coriobacteriales bacterium]|jgi:stage V sporulation protein SpoVS|nr:relaxase/mobilization nuclease domain-containing protein [Coriobacteriales bacterium]
MPKFGARRVHRSIVGVRNYLLFGKGEAYRKNLALGRNRVRAFHAENMVSLNPLDSWDKEMDASRKAAGNDTGWRGRKCVRANHLLLSPDPADKLSTHDVLELANEYCRVWFGSDGHTGSLGLYEWVVIVHDDGSHGVAHAHVIVNNTDLTNGKRLQISDASNRSLRHSLNDLARAHHLHYFNNDYASTLSRTEEERDEHYQVPEPEREAFTTPRNRSFAEIRAEGTGTYSWKSDIADRVRIAYETAKDMSGYVRSLNVMGISLDYSTSKAHAGDFIYRLTDQPSRQVGAWKLGNDFRSGNIKRYFSRDAQIKRQKSPESAAAAIAGQLWPRGARKVATVAPGANYSLKDISRALSFINTFGICSLAGFDKLEVRNPAAKAELANIQKVASEAKMLPARSVSQRPLSPLGEQARDIAARNKARGVGKYEKGTARDREREMFGSGSGRHHSSSGSRPQQHSPQSRGRSSPSRGAR